ncbi:MAG: aminotransferase class III-fold pyridoxal phosphate-dependent enzyme [Thaumarchaeota archaeon]|nr:aminotransferase class III-fold pyridoxal phosphate-dependent enzyme [Nitrososphaerota archaeon]
MVSPKIITELPGPKTRAVIEKDEKLLMQANWRYLPFVPKSGSGNFIEDIDGNVFLDLVSGAAVMNIGLGNQEVTDAVIQQANKFVYSAIPGYYYHDLVNDLAEKLIDLTPGSFDKKCFFGLSGADATDIAMKVTRFATGRHRFISFIGSNHGLGALGATALQGLGSSMVKGFGPLVPGVTHVPYPYPYQCAFGPNCEDCEATALNYLEEYVFKTTVPPEDTAAVFVEVIQGDGGVVAPSTGFFKRLREICDRHSIILVVDEVQTGLGRTGKMFAIEHHPDVEADLILLAKPLGNGLPMSACIGRSDLMKLPKGSLAITGAGHLLGCASALAAIEYTEKNNLCRSAEIVGRSFLKGLEELKEKHSLIGDVRGKGLLMGVELVKSRSKKEPALEEIVRINRIAYEKGLLTAYDGLKGNVFRIMPSLTLSEDEADLSVEILDRSFSEFEQERAS